MWFLVALLLGQCIFAGVVMFFLKRVLDRELVHSALEKFESCRNSNDLMEIIVCTAAEIKGEIKAQLESVRQRRMPQAKINYTENPSIQGGIVIALGDELMDYSLRSRLKNFWK